MENHQLFPFERNRYYTGKLLTSTDFQAEQAYMNGKRSFLNSFIFGQGVICGLSVFNLDDFSIMVESGAAIDGLGREIVVESSVVKRLAAIDGFESLQSQLVTLCLGYQEENIHPTYSVNRQERDGEYECNRIREGYRLFLMDSGETEDGYQMESEFYSEGRIYSGDDYVIDIRMPAIVSCSKQVKLVLQITGRGHGEKDIALDVKLQTPAFTNQEGLHELEIRTGNICLEENQVFEQEYWMMAQGQECESTNLVAKEEDIHIFYKGADCKETKGFRLKTSIQAISPGELVTRETGRTSLEMRGLNQKQDFIKLAQFKLMRSGTAYMIDEVEELQIKRYIPLPSGENLRAEYSSFYGTGWKNQRESDSQRTVSEEKTPSRRYREPAYATGICEIVLGANARRGLTRYSGEIMHGLGKGDVYVEMGLQYVKMDKALNTEARHTIYGDAELFMENEDIPVVMAQTAVKVQNDKGSFVAAVKLLEDTPLSFIQLRWVALKLPRENGLDEMENSRVKSIRAKTPTVCLSPGEYHYFGVTFQNMDMCSLVYSLTEPGSGEIGMDGVYTAPMKEGVYEVLIYCMEDPEICTYAYAVVKRKAKTD